VSSDATVAGGPAEALPFDGWEQPSGGRAGGLLWLLQGAEFAGEEDERVFARRGVQGVDVSYDDPVVAGGVLGDDLALEEGEGVRQQGYTAAPELPVEAGESVRPRGGWPVVRTARAVARAR
jgi:hypothetical protein